MELHKRIHHALDYLSRRMNEGHYHNQDGTFNKTVFMEALKFHLLDDLDVRLMSIYRE